MPLLLLAYAHGACVWCVRVRVCVGGVCEAGDNHSPPDSGFYDARLEQ